ncbi:MAG: amidophosphoribosyltransferase [Promethearchaeota archaeon]|nr:MAG: amidophosphoribosyltransferase [Candidatus Lokiarchaeota archaeon]
MQEKMRSNSSLRKPKEHCAVFGVSCDDVEYSITQFLYTGLISLQHRGQESSGISLLKKRGKIFTYKREGLVSKVLDKRHLFKYWGNIGIGHNRYATTGSEEFSSVDLMQPYHFKNDKIDFSFGFNGTIANYKEIQEEMKEKGHIFVNDTDTEVIAQLIASISLTTNNWPDILEKATETLDGSYSLILLTSNGEIYAIRDPLGFKPLCIGRKRTKKRTFYFVASESCAIDSLGGEFMRDVKPGEILHIDYQEGVKRDLILSNNKTAVCQFEFVYFARPDSIIDGISVFEARLNMGKNLARNDPKLKDPEFIKNAIVVPVPDSGRSAAVGYANESGLPYLEGLMKNRYVWRTFIMPGQQKRKSAVQEKLNPIKSVVNDKDIILIDDSIVRGNTTKQIIKLIKEAGAKSVNVRISAPPVISACYMGVDFPTTDELIAGKAFIKFGREKYIDRVKDIIGADTLIYQTIEGLEKAIGLKSGLCMACLTGKYPLKTLDNLSKVEESFTQTRKKRS